MEIVVLLFVWLVYWFGVWGWFNLKMVPDGRSLAKGGVNASWFFLAVMIPVSLLVGFLIGNWWYPILMIFSILLILWLKSNKALEANLWTDILFQQVMFYGLFLIVSFMFGLTEMFYLAGLLFVLTVFLSHLPLIFLKHLNSAGKAAVIMSVLPMAAVMYLVFSIFDGLLGVGINLLLHTLIYLIVTRSKKLMACGIIC